MNDSSFFDWPVRVYWEDTDAGGVVYYANYLKFLERARTEWLSALGLEQDQLATGAGVLFVVRRVEADYLRPARFNDRLLVKSRLSELGRASLVMDQEVLRGGERLLTARVRVACVEPAGFRPARIPGFVTEKLYP
ncbi:MAG: tol-pal system-associated acyl-CoA thioesterase [Hydrogenophilales bacterium CG17_big_fil_post_rev_8_21_14_2_50_63_12]|nr:MAG: tol-pal system-associated acyl-CoA thioesterase [Hydrogenophilales bacterium CG17_big_fil_post_rev_8_21_14_2_50_63_12]PIX96705.1 MAG: tol-pal system-associated acyl-CoA thioesterase [Hydrogenophilales bacterium CG_4_10_14_3_um_filter_63_21]PJB02511.1 MAG: tol-pal system-associated acyl-CoA thioesterase [Hydrogenophilales bacterium CG_4_9_14_3_um_filter_63_34]